MAATQERYKVFNVESYSDYPEAAKENAKIALRYAEEQTMKSKFIDCSNWMSPEKFASALYR